MEWCSDCWLWHSVTDDCVLKGTTMSWLRRMWNWLVGSGEKTVSCGGNCEECTEGRTVEWNKEQTEYLYRRLKSVESTKTKEDQR